MRRQVKGFVLMNTVEVDTLGVWASGSRSASAIADGRLINLAGEPGSLETHVSEYRDDGGGSS